MFSVIFSSEAPVAFGTKLREPGTLYFDDPGTIISPVFSLLFLGYGG